VCKRRGRSRPVKRYGLEDLEDVTAAEGWLFRIATRVCLDHLRRERLTELVDPVAFDELTASLL
jgi:DNA-directed RNA polymerase specialized sigma24 family protein